MTENEDKYSRLLPWASWYAGNLGWKILPVHGISPDGMCTCGLPHSEPKDRGKHPSSANGLKDATDDIFQIQGWWAQDPRYNVGVFCRDSGFLVVDVDPRSGGFESLDALEENAIGDILPATVEAMTGEYSNGGRLVRGKHFFYKVEPGEQFIGNLNALKLPGIDIKYNGYVLLAPSNHLSGAQYEWKPGHAPWEIEMAAPSEELLDLIRKGKKRAVRSSSGKGTEWEFVNDLEWGGEKLDLDKFLNDGINEGSRAVEIYAMSCAIANRYPKLDGLDRKNIETMMIRFNYEMVHPPLEQNELLKHVHNAIDFVKEHPVDPDPSIKVTAWESDLEERRRLVNNVTPAKRQDFKPTHEVQDVSIPYVETTLDGMLGGQVLEMARSGILFGQKPLDVPGDTDALTAEEGGDPRRRSLTDTGNGRRLVDAFNSSIRYTSGLGWFHWAQNYWRTDVEGLATAELAKRLPSIIDSEVAHYDKDDTEARSAIIKWGAKARQNATLDNAIKSAKSDPRILLGVEDWDRDENLLGTYSGVIDLRTGDLLTGNPELLISRRAPVSYTPGIRDARWEAFLDYATGGDKEYQRWLQRAVGYTLTGSRAYDVLFLVYGPAGSGKNVFVESIVKILGTNQYAWPLDTQVLAQGDGQSSGADLYHWAELRGRRMVWIDELPESERLKENSVKKLTGSTEISARSPGEKPFTFSARAKLWITTNHRPIISDDAMWRRIRPIPWMNTPTVPDPTLKEYIFDPEGGLPAVLAWAVEGAREILNSKESDALGWCQVVSDAAAIYRANEDRIGMFLSEEMFEAPGAQTSLKSLFTSYQAWCFDRSEKGLSFIAFARKLSDRGCTVQGTGGRAILFDYEMRPRVPDTGGQIAWDGMSIDTRF